MTNAWRRTALALVAASFCGLPQPQAQTSQLKGIAHVALRVADLELERRFFNDLGFEEAFSLTEAGNPSEIFVKINDHQFIELYPMKDTESSRGLMHVCYEAKALQELDALYRARGLAISTVVKGGAGNLIASLRDPDGNVIEFTQYLPGSRHFGDRGKHLGPHRISDALQGVTLQVSDLALATQFYADKLGFGQASGTPHQRLNISSDGEWISLNPGSPGSKAQIVFRVSDAAVAKSLLRQRAIRFISSDHGVSLEDPEGNRFAFVKSQSRRRAKSIRHAQRQPSTF